MNDARLDRDLSAPEPIRVATAIPSLVLGANDGTDATEERDRSDDALTDDGMLPHDGRLVVVEWARFVEDVAGNTDLADVMQQRAVFQKAQVVILEAQTPADRPRQRGRLP